jgi:ABC-2 type transport system ATP-binding protein
MKSVGLDGAEDKKLREYSQGMKKRFMLGVSMLSDPHNLLFDEVLNGLDPAGIAFFRQLTVDYKKEGRAILFSSHLLSEVEALADKIVIIHMGKIMKIIRREELAVLGGKSVRIVIGNIDQRAVEYLKTLGQVGVDGNTVTVRGYDGESSAVLMELAKMGFVVNEFAHVNESLEDYFFKVIGKTGGKA